MGAMPEAWLQRRLDSLAAQDAPPWLPRLLLASDFAFDVLRRDPSVLAGLAQRVADDRPPAARWVAGDGEPGAGLRRFRQAESVRLIARDLLGLDSVPATLAGASALADTCIGLALDGAQAEITVRHGALVDRDGRAGRPVVFALGKLGGGELNFSSDVDLVFAYPAGGPDSDGGRPLAPDAWHARVVQRTVQLLGEITAVGFVFRVDLRLRPFGQSGKPTLPFSAMEQYFQREGRDWERYAWLKARAVAGDVEAGEAFLAGLRPFVYRRYLDYTAIDALREMKAQVDLEVQRQDLLDDIKLGRGGIREIEFLVQVVQLVRGGREPQLRQRGLLPALDACTRAGFVPPARSQALRAAYLFLRRLENRLQMLRDAQTQALPVDPLDRERIATALEFPDWPALVAELDLHRGRVAEEFAQVLAPRRADRADRSGPMRALWHALAEGRADAASIEAAGVSIGDGLHERLRALARSPGVQALSARARDRLDRLMVAMLERLRTGAGDQDAEATAVVDLLQVLLRRSNYLALLEQQPAALERLFELARGSRWLLRQLVAQPLLLDDVFDPRAPAPPEPAEIAVELDRAGAGDDPELVLAALAEVRTSLHFRLGLAAVDRRLPATKIAARLALVAQSVLARVLELALAEVVRGHGWPAGAGPERCGLALLGYGSLGAAELGFASDLDLVFVFDGALAGAESSGPAPLEGQRFFARVVQKLIAYLAVPLPGGRLYAIDARLRPDGAKGLLVTSLDGYAAYQRERAWTWEQQALVRARWVAGDPVLAQRFAQLRRQALAQARPLPPLREAVRAMRERMRQELDRSGPGRFDLKQGRGGLVDLEFIVQFLVLAHAAGHPALLDAAGSDALLQRLAAAGVLAADTAAALVQAHADLLARSLVRTLDDRPRVLPPDPGIDRASAAIAGVWRALLEPTDPVADAGKA
jgi:glutamate-ammonia-ligase adenylyltransferase